MYWPRINRGDFVDQEWGKIDHENNDSRKDNALNPHQETTNKHDRNINDRSDVEDRCTNTDIIVDRL